VANERPDEFGYGAWDVTGAGTNAGVTVAHTTSPASATPHVTGIQVSGDAAALVTIESPPGTVLWRKRFTAAYAVTESFPATLVGAAGKNVQVKISASTSNCEANMQGYDA
jgi:hypothetical protein